VPEYFAHICATGAGPIRLTPHERPRSGGIESDCMLPVLPAHFPSAAIKSASVVSQGRQRVRKLIAFDDETFDKLKQLARDRMATLQELADEAFADLLRKHGIPVDLKDALRKSAALTKTLAPRNARSGPARKPKA
jgi:hypothetical protein